MRTVTAFALVSLLLASTASAQVTNGDFNTGLTGWTTSTTGLTTVYSYPPFGLPNNSALIDGSFNDPVGSGAISQTFFCGTGLNQGTCVIEFDYFLNSSSAVVKIEAIVDANTVYSVVYPTEPAGWVHGAVAVECGQRALTLKATCTSAGAFALWDVYFDNVTGICEVAVPTESSTWGKIKALYR